MVRSSNFLQRTQGWKENRIPGVEGIAVFKMAGWKIMLKTNGKLKVGPGSLLSRPLIRLSPCCFMWLFLLLKVVTSTVTSFVAAIEGDHRGPPGSLGDTSWYDFSVKRAGPKGMAMHCDFLGPLV